MPKPKYKTDVANVQEALAMLIWMPSYPKGDDMAPARKLIASAVAAFVDDRECDHAELGKIVPLEWLIQEIATVCRFYPKPIEIRELYEQVWPPLDGRSSDDLADPGRQEL